MGVQANWVQVPRVAINNRGLRRCCCCWCRSSGWRVDDVGVRCSRSCSCACHRRHGAAPQPTQQRKTAAAGRGAKRHPAHPSVKGRTEERKGASSTRSGPSGANCLSNAVTCGNGNVKKIKKQITKYNTYPHIYQTNPV